MLSSMPLLTALAVIGVGIVIAMLLAPLESLGWWAGWYGDYLKESALSPQPNNQATQCEGVNTASDKTAYLVFLDGIAKVGGNNDDDVQALLDTLSQAIPDVVVLGDVMPYSVTNTALTEARPLARFWRRADQWKIQGHYPLLSFTINIRNLFQVLVSADKRYGPTYNQAEAQVILNNLLEHGYQLDKRLPLTLIGYSGGGQIALGVVPYLQHTLGVTIDVISLGGVMSSDSGLSALRYVYHLVGSKDQVHKLGSLMFPGRWSIVFNSYWNQAKRQGKIHTIALGPMRHTGTASYLDAAKYLDDGQSFLEQTVSVIKTIVTQPATNHRVSGK